MAAHKTGSHEPETENINNLPGNDSTPVKRKRGRPKGSGKKGTRPDKNIIADPGENTKFLSHDMKLYNLPKIDVNDPVQVKQRINDYFSLCAADDIKPTIESLSLAFGISRITLFTWITGKVGTIKSIESLNTLKSAYNLINSYYAHMMNNGKINPVAGIFMMKNNLGYQDTTQYVLTTDNNNQLSITDISEKAGLLND